MENRIWNKIVDIFDDFIRAIIVIVTTIISTIVFVATLFFILVVCNPIAWIGLMIIAMAYKLIRG